MYYFDIAGYFLPSGATSVFDSGTSSMYAYQLFTWVGYDNPSTIGIKGAYMKNAGIAGYAFWPFHGDDSRLLLQRSARDAWK